MGQLRQVKALLTAGSLLTLVHAFVSSRLDYCNSLLYGASERVVSKLQSVQNTAARLVAGSHKFEHVTPVLWDLHWLPVRKGIRFKVALLVFKCLHRLAPPYLSDFCKPVAGFAGRQHLRSADNLTLLVPRTRSVFGSRSFAVAGPIVWNSLPVDLRSPALSVDTFSKKLKTNLMSECRL